MSKETREIRDITNEFPESIRPNFYCPISPYMLWTHDLIFKDCPMAKDQRDMPECSGCCLNDNKNKFVNKSKKSMTKQKERRQREKIPTIGKTYTSK